MSQTITAVSGVWAFHVSVELRDTVVVVKRAELVWLLIRRCGCCCLCLCWTFQDFTIHGVAQSSLDPLSTTTSGDHC